MRVAFLLSFVGLVFASQHVLQGDQDIQEALLDVQSQLSQLKDESPLIQAVTSLLDAGSPVDEIIDLLNKIRNDLLDEQTAANKQYEKDQEDCEEQIETLSAQISSLESEIEEIGNQVASLQSLSDSLDNKIADTQEEIDSLQTRLGENEGLRASIEEQNEVAAEIYQKDVSDHEEAIEALLQVKSLLESSTLYSNEALVEKIQDSNILSLSSTNAVRTTMVNKLLQLSQDPKDLALLMELIDQLLNDLRNALGRIQANEAIRTSQIDKELEDLKTQEDNIQSEIDEANEKLGELQTQQNDIRSQSNESKDKQDRLLEDINTSKEILGDVETRCKHIEQVYSEESDNRSEEIRTIEQCIDILNGVVVPRNENDENAEYYFEEGEDFEDLEDEDFEDSEGEDFEDLEEDEEVVIGFFDSQGKPLIKLPSGLKTPSSPSNKNYARFGNMFTATSAVNKNYRKEPNFESIMTDFSPTNWRKSSSSSSVEAKSSTKKKPCGSNFWKETETLYFVGYIWVPSGTKTLEFNTGADDRGFIYINGERVAKRSCCKVTKTKVNVKNSKIKTNSWNLVFGTGADGCKGGWLRMRTLSAKK